MAKERTKLIVEFEGQYEKPKPREIQSVLTTIQKSLSDASDLLIKDVMDEDIVLFLGNTRAGKSTVVNYVIGNKLCVKPVGTKSLTLGTQNSIIVKAEHDPLNKSGPAIGISSKAETTIPSKWVSKYIPQTIWDCPGFDDNRGTAQDITNAFYVKELLSHARSAKFAIVSDIRDLDADNIKPFIDFLNKVSTILPDIQQLTQGISMIFTKVQSGIKVSDIQQVLTEKIIQPQGIQISDSVRAIVEYFVQQPQSIGIFKKAIEEGPIDPEELNFGMTKAINMTQTLDKELLSSANIGISTESLLFMHYAYHELNIMSQFEVLLESIKEIYLGKIERIREVAKVSGDNEAQLIIDKDEILALKTQISAIRKQPAVNLEQIIIHLTSSNQDINKLVTSSKIIAQTKFVTFIGKILKIDHTNDFLNKLSITLSAIEKEISLQLGEIDRTKAVLLKKEVSKSYEAAVQECEAIEHELKIEKETQISSGIERGLKLFGAGVGGVVLGVVGAALAIPLLPIAALAYGFIAPSMLSTYWEEKEAESKAKTKLLECTKSAKEREKEIRKTQELANNKVIKALAAKTIMDQKLKEAIEAEGGISKLLSDIPASGDDSQMKSLVEQDKSAKLQLEIAKKECFKADAYATHISKSARVLEQLVDAEKQATKKLSIAKSSIITPEEEVHKTFTEIIRKEDDELEKGLDVEKMVADAQKLLDAAKAFATEWSLLMSCKRAVDYEVAAQEQGDAEHAIENELSLLKLDESSEGDLPPLVGVLAGDFPEALLVGADAQMGNVVVHTE